MPLQAQPLEIILGGLDQKAGRLTRNPGALDRCINGEFEKAAAGGCRINKRRGYQRIDPSNTVNRFDTDTILTHCTQYGGELVVFTYDYVAGLGSRDAALRGEDALVYRGPCNRGACQLDILAAAPLSQQAVVAEGA